MNIFFLWQDFARPTIEARTILCSPLSRRLSGRIRDGRSERERKREERLPQGRCNYCTSRRLFEYVRTVGTNLSGTPNDGTRQYSSSLYPRRTLTAAWPRERPAEGKTVKRYTALKSTFSLLNFIGRRRRTVIPSYRAATVVFMMGIPVTAKCKREMQRGRIIRQTAFCPSIAMTFTIVKSRTGPLAIIKPPDSTWVSDGSRYAVMQRNAT